MKSVAIIISLLSLISAYAFNELNLVWLKKDSVSLRINETVKTADDDSYISPALFFLETGEFKNGMPGKGAYFLRPPGYSSIFVVLGTFFNTQTTLKLLKYIQLFLFALSVFCLLYIAYAFIGSKGIAVFITAFYGISNIASGFLYYTLTEGVTPAFVIFFVYFLLKAKDKENRLPKILNYYIGSIIFSFLFITRPVLGVIGLAIPFFLYDEIWKHKKMKIYHFFTIGLIASSSMLFWQLRNVNIADKFVGLHPIYYIENSAGCFRPTHKTLWNLYKGWGTRGSDFHASIVPFWNSAIEGNPSSTDIDVIIGTIPSKVLKKIGKHRFEQMFRSYQESILYQKYFHDNKIPMPQTLPEIEIKTITQINALIHDFKRNFWLDYYVYSPLKVLKELTFHSNLSLYIFQKTYRGNVFMELFRLMCFSIHSVIYLSLIFSFFIKRPLYLNSIFSYSLIIYVGYLIFFQRGIEERYTLPILPLVLVSFGYWLKKMELVLPSLGKTFGK